MLLLLSGDGNLGGDHDSNGEGAGNCDHDEEEEDKHEVDVCRACLAHYTTVLLLDYFRVLSVR